MKSSLIGPKNKKSRKSIRSPRRSEAIDTIIDIARSLIEYGRHHYNSICRFNHQVDVSERGRITVDGESYGSDPEFIKVAKFLYHSGYNIKFVQNHPTLVDPEGDFAELTVNDAMRMMKGR